VYNKHAEKGIDMKYKIYLVEDEENLNNILTMYLKKEGYIVKSFLKGEDARQSIANEPHLWILDIMLTDIDGYQLIKEIKANNEKTPVIFMSARNAELDRVIGLELGSDDYLSKPFLPRELVIRTKKLLTRIYGEESYGINKSIQLKPYTIDEDRRVIEYADQIIELTSKEFDLVLFLAQNIGKAFSRDQLLNHVWDKNYFGSERVVDDTIRRIRKKMPDMNIETIYGYGYRLVKNR